MKLISNLLAIVRTRPILTISTALLLVVLWQLVRPAATVEETPTTPLLPIVTLTSAAAEAGDASLRTIGTVRAFESGAITAERGGRVVSVPVTLGQAVTAGQVIAQLENASERAAVTQAEGAFAAAQAAASQSVQQNDSGVRNAEIALQSAQNGVITAIQGGFTTANNTLVSTVDQFYANPLGLNPGIRIGRTDTPYLRTERIAFQDIMIEWRTTSQAVSYSPSSLDDLATSEAHTERLLQVVDHLIGATTEADSDDTLAGRPVTSYTPTLIAERGALVASLQSMRAARLALTQAEEGLARAQIADTSGRAELAEAQVKQAQGALDAARAALAKTTLRTPVSGTINALSVRTGDFIAPNVQVATVANNEALEVVTFINTTERNLVTIGDTVQIDGAASGTVIAISPAVDPATRKIEVRIAIDGTTSVKNGDTVTITTSATAPETNGPLTLPLTAVRFQDTNGFVFENRLVVVPVRLGPVRGSQIVITDGLAADQLVVADARGLAEGDEVTLRN